MAKGTQTVGTSGNTKKGNKSPKRTSIGHSHFTRPKNKNTRRIRGKVGYRGQGR